MLFRYNTYFRVTQRTGEGAKRLLEAQLKCDLSHVQVFELDEVPEAQVSADRAVAAGQALLAAVQVTRLVGLGLWVQFGLLGGLIGKGEELSGGMFSDTLCYTEYTRNTVCPDRVRDRVLHRVRQTFC